MSISLEKTSSIPHFSHNGANYFKNHQGWEISRFFTIEGEVPIFTAKDAYGISYTIKEFVVEDVDEAFGNEITGSLDSEERSSKLSAYLQKRLATSSAYQVHIERHKGELFLRVGSYGLKGGMNICGLEVSDRKIAIGLNFVAIIAGVYLNNKGTIGAACGGTLISAGIYGGLYAYEKKDGNAEEYAKKTAEGALMGLVSATAGLGVDRVASILKNRKILPISSSFRLKLAASGINVFLKTGISELITQGIKKGVNNIPVLSILKKSGIQGVQTVVQEVSYAELEPRLLVVCIALSNAYGKYASYLGPDFRRRASYIVPPLWLATFDCIIAVPSIVFGQALTYLAQHPYSKPLMIQGIKKSITYGSSLTFLISFFNNSKFAYQGYSLVRKTPLGPKVSTTIEPKYEKVYRQIVASNTLPTYKVAFDEVEKFSSECLQLSQSLKGLEEKAKLTETLALQLILLKHQSGGEYSGEQLPRMVQGLCDTATHLSGFAQLGKHFLDRSQANIDGPCDKNLEFVHQQLLQTLSRADGQRQFITNWLITFSKIKPLFNKFMSIQDINILKDSIRISFPFGKPLASLDEIFNTICPVSSFAELASHVALVHAGTLDILAYRPELLDTLHDAASRVVECLKIIVTPDGKVGSHLDEDRPLERQTMHWCWNQLVQPHNAGNWESSQFAILEPLSSFEGSLDHRPIGIASYDTFIMKSHTLSKDAILLVPLAALSQVREYYTRFAGKIYPYDGEIRKAIFDTLNSSERMGGRQIWHICDAEGNPIGREVHPTSTGEIPITYLKRADGTCVEVERNTEGRYQGLHAHFLTGANFEDNNRYFQILRNIGDNPSMLKAILREGRRNFLFAHEIQYSTDIDRFATKQALDFLNTTNRYELQTSAGRVGKTIMTWGIFTDIIGLFYQLNPGASDFGLSFFELKWIVDKEYDRLLLFCKNPDFLDFEERYASILKRRLNTVLNARERVLQDSMVPTEGSPPSFLLELSEARCKQLLETRPLDCNLMRYSPSHTREDLHHYLYYTLYPSLPKEQHKLVTLLSQLLALRQEEEKEHLILLTSFIQLVLIEQAAACSMLSD